jgi:hypothetical protein
VFFTKGYLVMPIQPNVVFYKFGIGSVFFGHCIEEVEFFFINLYAYLRFF